MTVYVQTSNKGSVNLREKPDKSSKALAQIPYNTKLEVEYVDSKWSKAVYNGKTGYVMTEFLTSNKSFSKSDLQAIYDSLKSTLTMIEKLLK